MNCLYRTPYYTVIGVLRLVVYKGFNIGKFDEYFWKIEIKKTKILRNKIMKNSANYKCDNWTISSVVCSNRNFEENLLVPKHRYPVSQSKSSR